MSTDWVLGDRMNLIVRAMPIAEFSASGARRWSRGWDQPPWGIVLHFAATGTSLATLQVLERRDLSTHASVERDGTAYQHVDLRHRCYHAGPSTWAGVEALNEHMLGIEIVNFGPFDGEYDGTSPHLVFDWELERPDDPELLTAPGGRKWYRDETYKRIVRVVSRQSAVSAPDGTLWAAYPEQQVRRVAWLVSRWCEVFGILPENVVGHDQVAPGRKSDPGPAWPWALFHTELRAALEPGRPHLYDPDYLPAARIRAMQSHLRRLGTDVGPIDGIWGRRTDDALRVALGPSARSTTVTHLCVMLASVR